MNFAEQIQLIIFDRLCQMTQVNGYEYDWTWYRGRAPEDPANKPAGLMVDGGDTYEELTDPYLFPTMTLELHAIHSASDAHDAEPHATQVVRRLTSDLMRRVGQMRTDTDLQGELRTYGVTDMSITRIFPFPDFLGDGSAVAIATLEVDYRHKIDDPGSK